MKKRLLAAAIGLLPILAPAQETETYDKDGTSVPARVYFKDGKLHFASKNEKFHLWFDNRIYIDGSYYAPTSDITGLSSKPNKDLEEDDGIFRFNNGVSIRRARFALKAELYNWFATSTLPTTKSKSRTCSWDTGSTTTSRYRQGTSRNP